MTHYYDFKFGDDNAGWFEITQSPGMYEMNATFTMESDIYTNPFAFKYEQGQVTVYRIADGDWIPMPEGENLFPTSAYPLLVPKVKDTLTYEMFHEGEQKSLGTYELVREGDLIIEKKDGQVNRRFKVEDGIITWIDWHGPQSTLKPTLADAKKGSSFE